MDLRPYLERFPEQGGPAERVVLEKLPFTLGRAEEADHRVYSSPVSKLHAAIVDAHGRYAVLDLGSTNGTFVNGVRVEEQALADGDIIHLAHVEFCFRSGSRTAVSAPAPEPSAFDQTQPLPLNQPDSLIRGAALLRELIGSEAVHTAFEPIVDLLTGEVIGFEALGRGDHPELPTAPAPLLDLADRCSMVVGLSTLFRKVAIIESRKLPPGPRLFLNVHPRELEDAALAVALADLPLPDPQDRQIVMEIAESSVTNTELLAHHRAALAALDLEFAYDDFGAGYARLVELTDVPPAYLKLDRLLIEGIDAQARQDLVSALVGVADSLGVKVIAEGVTTRETAATCLRLGCRFGQGFLFPPFQTARASRKSSRRKGHEHGQPRATSIRPKTKTRT